MLVCMTQVVRQEKLIKLSRASAPTPREAVSGGLNVGQSNRCISSHLCIAF